MSAVEVLCLNGRRQKVRTTPNTKVLQILEECCVKQGFTPVSDYDLKHGRKTLDTTLTVRFAGLPNLAKLEMVRAEKSHAETDVMLALQLPTGERLQHQFPPSCTLWEILAHWEQQKDSELAGKLMKSDALDLHPAIVYMREEVIGEYALKETSLRQLGLTGGKAIFRFSHKAVDDCILVSIKEKIDKEKARKNRLTEKPTTATSLATSTKSSSQNQKTLPTSQVEPSPRFPELSTEQCDMDINPQENIDRKTDSKDNCMPLNRAEEPMETSCTEPTQRCGGTVEGMAQTMSLADVGRIPGVEVLRPEECVLTPHEQQQAIEYARTILPGLFPQMLSDPAPDVRPQTVPVLSQDVFPQSVPEFKFPEATKGKKLYLNEMSEARKDDYKPCDRETIMYSLESRSSSELQEEGAVAAAGVAEDLPDDFFELTERDLRSRMAELQKKIAEEEDKPLMTSSMKLAAREARASKYERVIIRFLFPDKTVLQALFRPRETVYSLQKFVKEYLEDKETQFYLYTTPPKHILKDTSQTLIEADLIPMSLVYIGSENKRENYLSQDLSKDLKAQEDADRVVLKHMSIDTNPQPGPSGLSQSGSVNAKRPTSSSTDQAAAAGTSGQKVPKWFKIGKK